MDSDCLICLGAHNSSDCPERNEEHCPNCHIVIKNSADHSSVCGMKTWIFKPYAYMYVEPPKERCIIGVNTPFRFLKDGCWRKGCDGLELLSPETGSLFEFKFDNDICLKTTRFAPLRMVIVVKDAKQTTNKQFREKLLLLTSKQQMMVAVKLDKPFDRTAVPEVHDWCTTLILVVSSKDL